MIPIAGAIASAVLAGIGVLHIVWAFGARPLSSGAIPTRADGSPLFAPGTGVTLGVAALLLVAAFLVLERSGLGPGLLPGPWPELGSAGVAGVLLLRGIGEFRYVGLFKRERTTAFARLDTLLFTPLVLTLATLSAVVARWGK
jgi:hypothetical protein